ncbi:MAG: aminotransferase class III-fold pyridoxal phosphate-dependent enzyme, partial [Cognatishimia sp.]
WKNLAASHDLDISISGLTAISGFSIKSDRALGYKTLITQQALKAGYLAGTAFYSCKAHTTDILDAYEPVLDETFKLINDCENGRDLNTLLDGPICHSGFKRLN